ncbi:GntR family transcriptional regulator [Pseudokineococcus lusitanus]|uniref:GntR family transcriptional regulator n=1 Tax=Pseudokineococcus lusitanus TaxID=763993 RepID=A0A3N1HSY4_9ACTN|nr:GntR family transcriptional regulator [Pseudokineococcus lusitanus]
MLDDGSPLFQQIARQVSDGVLVGTFPEGTQVPSTTELAALHRINPATVGKGLALLVAEEVLHKRRGLGMFVSDGARERLVERRRGELATTYVRPLVAEARSLGLAADDVLALVAQQLRDDGPAPTTRRPPVPTPARTTPEGAR